MTLSVVSQSATYFQFTVKYTGKMTKDQICVVEKYHQIKIVAWSIVVIIIVLFHR